MRSLRMMLSNVAEAQAIKEITKTISKTPKNYRLFLTVRSSVAEPVRYDLLSV